MKKSLTLILAGALALSLVACGGNAQGASSFAGSGSLQNVDLPITATSHFGKITSVAGNEIEMNLAKEPEMPEPDESAAPGDTISMDAIAMTPATPAGDGTDGGGAAQRAEIELTGELKSFTIPAGMPIKDAMGNEKQLTDIKKGSTVNVFVDENGAVTEVFLYE